MDVEGAGAGTGAVQGGDATEGAGSAGAGGGAGTGQPGDGGAAGGTQFDRGKLHPALREMKPEEISELFETMANTLRTVQSRPAEPDLSGVPAHARTPEPPKVPELGKDKLKVMFDPNSEEFDPEGAFKVLAAKNYGQLVGDVNMRSLRGMYSQFEAQLPDFREYEGEITTALTQTGRDPTTLSERDILTMYFQAKGMKQTLKDRQEAGRRSASTIPPTPEPPGKKKDTELSELETEIAHRMFRRIEDPAKRVAEYKKYAGYDEGGISVKVPIGGGKVA